MFLTANGISVCPKTFVSVSSSTRQTPWAVLMKLVVRQSTPVDEPTLM